jgi:hypothetical protein
VTGAVTEVRHHLAQFNIARMADELGTPTMAGFEAGLDEINAVADASPGFVWRLEDDAGHATSYRPYPDDRMIINLSVWASVEALRAFTYGPEHVAFLRRRRQWFDKPLDPFLALWWVPAGHRPGVEEGVTRLEVLRRSGATPDAFTFKDRFDPPAAPSAGAPLDPLA